MTPTQALLFQPTRIGDIEVANRVVMAPLTRCRADEAAGDVAAAFVDHRNGVDNDRVECVREM